MDYLFSPDCNEHPAMAGFAIADGNEKRENGWIVGAGDLLRENMFDWGFVFL